MARIGKKPYAIVPNAARRKWLSVKPGQQHRHERRLRVLLGDEPLDDVPERRLEGRSSTALRRPEPVELVAVATQLLVDERLDLRTGSRPAGCGSRRRSRRRAGITLRFPEADDLGRRDGRPEHRLDHRRGRRRGVSESRHGDGRILGLADHGGQERPRLGQKPQRRVQPGDALEQRRRLDERVVAEARHRRVAALPVHTYAKRRACLLGGGAEVERAVGDVDPVAAALVDAPGRAHRRRDAPRTATRGRSRSPTSSSAVAAKMRSPSGSKPARASVAIATAFAATWPFMSSAPRPHT